MKLYKLDIDIALPSRNIVKVDANSDFILAVRVRLNGVTQTGLTLEDDEDQCLIECDYEFGDYNTYKLNKSSDFRCHTHIGERKISDITIDVVETNSLDVDYTESVPEPEPVVVKPKVVFSQKWCETADKNEISVQYDNGDYVKVFPGCEATPTNVSYMGFAKYCDLSGSSNGDFKLAMSGINIDKDTLMIEHCNGYTLYNTVNMAIPILKNRSQNVNVQPESYTRNVCCFKSSENLPLKYPGGNTFFLMAGNELFLSAHCSIVNIE